MFSIRKFISDVFDKSFIFDRKLLSAFSLFRDLCLTKLRTISAVNFGFVFFSFIFFQFFVCKFILTFLLTLKTLKSLENILNDCLKVWSQGKKYRKID